MTNRSLLFILVLLPLLLLVATSKAEPEEQATDSLLSDEAVVIDDGEARTGSRGCTFRDWLSAQVHCDLHHAPISAMYCKLQSCTVRNGWIVYSWSGYSCPSCT